MWSGSCLFHSFGSRQHSQLSLFFLVLVSSISEACLQSQTVVVASTLDLSAIDQSPDLRPFTAYAYQVFASTDGGIGSSPFGLVITPESSPTGVMPPNVTSSTARAHTLQWFAPSSPNGVILGYRLLRNGTVVHNATSPTQFMDSGLLPATLYTYSVQACTSAGCTVSPLVAAVTLESTPEGVQAPTAVLALSATSIRVEWASPGRPNGVIVRYEVLVNGSTAVTTNGTTNVAAVTGLQPFAIYVVAIRACTVIGCTDGPSSLVMTLEAAPVGFSAPSLMVLTSMSIDISWSLPVMPQGILLGFSVYRNNTLVANVSASTLSYVDSSLSPHTTYSYVVAVHNSAGSTSTVPVSARTAQDTPQGVQAPNVTVINSTSFLVRVSPPSQPNGIIVNYSVIVDDATVFPLGPTRNAAISGFLPFTSHQFRTQACTVQGCGISTPTRERTAESLASGIPAPNISAINSSAIGIFWSEPQDPNGIVQEYIIHRVFPDNVTVHRQPASANNFIYIDNGLSPFSNYAYRIGVINGAGVSFSPVSGEQTDEAPPLTIGLAVSVVAGQRSAQLQWTTPPVPNGVLVFYRIESRLLGDANVTDIASLPASNPNNFTIVGLLPFTPYEFRVVAVNSAGEGASPWQAATTLEDVPEMLQPIRVDGRATDGTSLNLSWAMPLMPNGVITRYSVLHNGVQEYTGVTAFFIFRRLTPATSYRLILQACTSAGCADGVEQTVQTAETSPRQQSAPTVQALGSMLVRVRWSAPSDPNGVIVMYVIHRKLSSAADSTAVEVLRAAAQSLSALEYNDTVSLQPFTDYQYRVTSGNSVAQVSSPFSASVRTLPASPEGVPAIVVTTVNHAMLRLAWTAPTKPNGIISGYNVYRNNMSIATISASTLAFADISGILPFTTYTYQLEACTVSAGCSRGPTSSGQTAASRPTSVSQPTLFPIDSSSLFVNWSAPAQPNGVISEYRLYAGPCGSSPQQVYRGPSREEALTNLSAFSCYSAHVEACTSVGCSNGSSASATTPEAAPEGLVAPNILVLGQDQVQLRFDEPSQPNGAIVSYEIQRNGSVVTFVNDSSSGSLFPALFVDRQLTASTLYMYVVIFSTDGGSSASPPAFVRTNPPPPEGLDEPTITPSNTSLLVTWLAPVNSFSAITKYAVFLDGNQVHTNDGSSLTTRLSNLTPFTSYNVVIEACTAFGCVRSNLTSSQTLQGHPGAINAPVVQETSLRQILVSWTAPAMPNGIVTGYTLQRRRFVNSQPVSGSTIVLGTFVPSVTAFNDTDNVLSFSVYEYRVQVSNGAGMTISPWQRIQTSEGVPEGLQLPTVTETADTSVSFQLRPPETANGIITQYNLIVNSMVEPTNYTATQTHTLQDLVPGSLYRVQVQICTSAGCAMTSDALSVITLEAAPLGFGSVEAANITSTSFTVTWLPPAMPNGNIIR